MDRSELAALLRDARARGGPRDAGATSGIRPRPSGLRCEDVARLAGVSVEDVVRLEQGDGPRPSTSTLTALARALRMNDEDRDLMFQFAAPAPSPADQIQLEVRPSVLRLLDRMADLPALVLSAKADVLAWNSMATGLLGDFAAWPRAERNMIWQRFLGTERGNVRMTPVEAQEASESSVSALRGARVRYPDDIGLLRLVSALRARSPRFEQLWRERPGAPRSSPTKRIDHPEFGTLVLDCDTMLLPDTDQSVVVYSAAPGTEAAAGLDLLRATAQLTERR